MESNCAKHHGKLFVVYYQHVEANWLGLSLN